MDLKSGTLDHLNIEKDKIIQLTDNNLYHTVDDGSLYAFDLNERKDSLIYKFEKTAGVYIDPKYQYQIINGNIFACDMKAPEIRWFRLTGYGENASVIDIDCPVESFSAYKIGTITSYKCETNCPFCGKKVLYSSYELFQLDEGYSEHTSKINEMLKEKKNQFLNDNSEIEPYIEAESDCENHRDPYNFLASKEESVSAANIYNSRFLVVNMSYWWEAGGPHGYYHSDIYVFDLSTGEELGIKNFYPGTESEFKALIAEKIKEDYNENPRHYEGRTESDAYDSAYSLTSFDSTSIGYYGDHITYCFNVYEIGSYADSEYLVDVTCEELNGNPELTRVR